MSTLPDIISIELDALQDLLSGSHELAAASLSEAARRIDQLNSERTRAAAPRDVQDCARRLAGLVQAQVAALGQSGDPLSRALHGHASELWRIARYLEDAQGAQAAPGLALDEIRTVDGDNRRAILEALSELLAGDGEYVIIDIAGTDSFVQFAREDGGLVLDLPAVGLEPAERLAALAYFERSGVAAADWLRRMGDPEFAFQVPLGRDAGRAARMAGELFEQVYRAGSDPRLSITVN